MKGPTGRAAQLPRDLLNAVTTAATRLGLDVASDDLFLLALLELPEGVTARRVLEAEGSNSERVLEDIQTRDHSPADPSKGLRFPPAFNEMYGRAQAFAASLGDGEITPEHALLAMIWDPTSSSSQLLWRLGVRRERIVARLRDDGVAVPTVQLPEQREIDVGERVWFDRRYVMQVIDHVAKRVPPGTDWGFNHEGDRAWVVGESQVDFQALVDEALSEPGPVER